MLRSKRLAEGGVLQRYEVRQGIRLLLRVGKWSALEFLAEPGSAGKRKTSMKKCTLFLALCAIAFAQEETPDKRLRHSAETFREIMAPPDKAIPRDLLGRAECVVIVPGMKKAAFVAGGEYGKGFASCRTGTGWSGPSAVRLAGGSFGLQLGADSTDVVLSIMNEDGLHHMLSDKFTIGADATAAAGPVGRDAKAETDAVVHAEVLSWSRSRGIFAGVSVNGTAVETDKGENEKLYGRPEPHNAILRGQVRPPEAARVLTAELDEYAGHRNSADRQRDH
ncbi:MAG TPA: lipid-binding SYLF domain-containing protein [Bryobacteraceae bacterium]|nr:lipid-binding SYLF domain-containing protein [Bryobacteraceae bacterium]